VQLYLTEDELHTNAPDVEAQFLAELRAYRAPGPHPNIVAFLGCLDAVGMVLEFVEGDTFFERVVKKRTGGPVVFSLANPAVTQRLKVEWFNQLVDALVHVHRHGLSHGDINTLNVMITYPSAHPPNSVKLIDFGRSTYFNPLPPSNTTTAGGYVSSFHARHPNLGSSTTPAVSQVYVIKLFEMSAYSYFMFFSS
jgi:serine/threonine protein kinase